MWLWGRCYYNCFQSPERIEFSTFHGSLKLINRVLCVRLHTCNNLDLKVIFNSVGILTTLPRTLSVFANVWQLKGRKFGSCLILV